MQEGIDDSLMDTGAGVPILEETYPVSPPFSYVLIQTDPVSKRTTYMVVEIPLDNKEQAIYKKILDIMIEELDIERDKLNQEKAEEFLKKKIVDIIKRYRISLNESQFEKIMYYLSRDLIGYGKIQPLMLDPNIEDISNDGVGVPIYVWHRKYESIATNVVFEEEDALDSFIIKMAQRANRHVSIANPLLDASLPDGSRVQLSYGKEVTQRGSTFTIRKFKADPFTISDLILYNTIDLDIAAYYWYVMEHNVSILVAGGTAAGKTTLLNTLAMMIKPNMKVVTIEDSVTPDSELLIKKDNSFVRVTIGDLVDEMIDKYPSRKLDSGHEVCSINPENIEIQSMQNGSIKFTPITSFIRHKTNKKIYQVITSTGRRIKVTGDHSLFTLDENCKVTQIATRDLRMGDKIATPRSLESSKNEVTATSDILWDKIVSIEELDSKFDYVYDLSISEMENFVCENIVVHNTAELNLAHENWIPSVVRSGFGEASETGFRRGQISMYELLRAAMRQRPDYIIVGEIRGSEAYAMFQAMSTGHRGLGTIHGDSVEGVIHRLESKPMDIPRSMMKSLDIIHVIRKVRHKSKFARRTMAITEIIGLDPVTEELLTNKIYQWNAREDAYINFGRSYVIEKIMENTGDTEREIQEEMERRKTILRWMTKKRVRYFEDVASILQEYYADPDGSLEKARKGLKG